MSAAQLSSLTSKRKIGLASGLLASAFVSAGYQVACAYPEGAPWGAADPHAAENCNTCHFDNDPVHDSSALSIEGLPEKLTPDTIYDLVITFDNPDGVAAGFQLIAWAENEDAGSFAAKSENIEAAGSAMRSTAPTFEKGSVTWAVQWQTPAAMNATISIYLAATAANHDQSPLGDRVYFRSFSYTLD